MSDRVHLFSRMLDVDAALQVLKIRSRSRQKEAGCFFRLKPQAASTLFDLQIEQQPRLNRMKSERSEKNVARLSFSRV